MNELVTRSATINLGAESDDGTPGLYKSDSGFSCIIGQLPWRDVDGNGVGDNDTSRVNTARYLVKWVWSNAHKCNLYELQDVKGRTHCQIHKGNFCGDVKKGRCSDVLGCFLPGKLWVLFKKDSVKPGKPPMDQYGVTASGTTLAELEADMRDPATGEQVSFWLTIE